MLFDKGICIDYFSVDKRCNCSVLCLMGVLLCDKDTLAVDEFLPVFSSQTKLIFKIASSIKKLFVFEAIYDFKK